MRIKIGDIDKKRTQNGELARLAACYAMPPMLREQNPGGPQLPRFFPTEQLVALHEDEDKNHVVVRDAHTHARAVKETAKTETWGLPEKLWNPMKGEYTHEKRASEIRTAIALLKEELKRLSK